jgi:hypothetical protein
MSDYCKHGIYVGNAYTGDHMCGRCEDDTPDPTPRELRADLVRACENVENRAALWESIVAKSAFPAMLLTHENVHREVMREALGEMRSARRRLTHALWWATHEDDDEWLDTRHRADEERWNAQPV